MADHGQRERRSLTIFLTLDDTLLPRGFRLNTDPKLSPFSSSLPRSFEVIEIAAKTLIKREESRGRKIGFLENWDRSKTRIGYRRISRNPIKFPSITRGANYYLALHTVVLFLTKGRGERDLRNARQRLLKGCVSRNRDNVTAGLSTSRSKISKVRRWLLYAISLCLWVSRASGNCVASYVTYRGKKAKERKL